MALSQMMPGEAELAGKLGKPFRHLARKFMAQRQQRPDLGLDPTASPLPGASEELLEDKPKRLALRGGKGYMNPNSARSLLVP